MAQQTIRKILVLSAYPPQRYQVASGQWAWKLWEGFYKDTADKELKSPIVRYAKPTKIGVTDLTGAKCWISGGLLYMFQDEIRDTSYTFTDTDGNTTIKDIISDLTELGMAQNIIAYYEIPAMFLQGIDAVNRYNPALPVEENGEAGGVIITLSNKTYNGNFTYSPIVAVYNNKARYGQSVTITVYSPASGQKLVKKIYDLLPLGADPRQSSYILAYTIGADIRPQGSPIFSWNYNDGGTDQRAMMTEYIKGGTWKTLDTIKVGVDGAYFEKLNIRLQQEEATKDIAGKFIGGAINVGIGAGTGNPMSTAQGISDMSSAFGEYARLSDRVKMQTEILNQKGTVAFAPVQIGDSDYARDTGKNWFYNCRTQYCAEDMQSFDQFLTKYGYNVGNMPIGTQHFWCRSDFVFIRINDITIVSKKAGKEMLDKVSDQLKAGVRIWRTKPNIDSMLPSGNRGACPEDN